MYVEGSGRRLIQVRVPYQILADGGFKITTRPCQHNQLRGLDSNLAIPVRKYKL